MSFELNRGQADEPVRFLARGRGYTLMLSPTDTALALNKDRSESAIVHMKLAGANPKPGLAGVDELPGKVNYFIGNDPKQWRTNVPAFAKVKYTDVYPGIDLIYYGNQSQLEYDFVVAPGADPRSIRFTFDDRESLAIDASGDLVLHPGDGKIRMKKPAVYQALKGGRHEIPSQYVFLRHNEINFAVGAYDKQAPLVIDPVVIYATYLGGDNLDKGTGIAVDASGSAYVTGFTLSRNFPANADMAHNAGDYDIFVTKFNASGSALVYSDYIGGSSGDGLTGQGGDYTPGIAVDGSGNAWVTGSTSSTNFPTMNPLHASRQGLTDVFVLKLNAAGSALMYSTYLGGSSEEFGGGIAVDPSGNAYLTGVTDSTDFPVVNAIQPSRGGVGTGTWDAFVTKFDSTGSVIYSTYLGGSQDDYGYAIAADANGNAYVTGFTGSTDFPMKNPLQPVNNGAADVFVTKLNPTGFALVYSTYLGGRDVDSGRGIAVDGAGNVFVVGSTHSSDFPTRNALQPTYGNFYDAFVSELNAQASALVYSTFIGGSSPDFGQAIALDASGNACISYWVNGAGTVSKLNAAGSGFVYTTTLGGPTAGIAVDSQGNAYVTGYVTGNSISPVNAFRSSYAGGSSDAFVMKLSNAGPPVISSISPSSGALGATFNAIIGGGNLNGATAVTFSGTGVTGTVLSGGSEASVPVSIAIDSNATTGLRTFTLTGSNGTSSPFSGFTVLTPPVISSISPSSGVQGLIRRATVAGTDLTGATAVSVSGTGVTGTVLSGGTSTSVPVSLTVAPAAVVGARTVTVTTPGGPSQAFSSFTIAAPATISPAVPVSSSLGPSAQSELMAGRNAERYQFTLATPRGVTISEQSGAFDSYLYLLSSDGTVITQDDDSGGNSNSLIHASLNAGTYIVEATSYTASQAGAYTLTLTAGPTITSISPAQALPGDSLSATIMGGDLAGATAVTFSGTGVSGTVTGSTATTVSVSIAVAADASPGLRTVTVTGADGTTPAFSGFAIGAVASPVINSLDANPPGLSQAVAPWYGGPFTLTVNGSNFAAGALVSLGQTSLATTRIDSTRLAAAVTSASLAATGAFDVRVTNPSGPSSNAVTMKVIVRGDVNNSTKVNIGDALTLALNVGAVTRPPMPPSVADLNLSSISNIGDALTLALFAGRSTANFVTPSITAVSPSPAVTASTLTINGIGFAPNAADNQVLFTTSDNIVRVTPSAATPTSLTVTTPANAVSGPLQVYRIDAPLGGAVFPLLISAAPTPLLLTSITPYFQLVPGSAVTLSGIGFDPTPANNIVRFRNAAGSSMAAVASATTTSLSVTVPNDAVCGPVTVGAGAQTSNARAVVVQSANPCSLQLVDLWGGGSPGDTVVIEGTGFDVVTPANNVVQFSAVNGGTVAAPVLAAGGTQLHVRIPASAGDGGVTVATGSATSNAISYHRPNVMSPSSIDVVVNSPDAVGSYQVTIGYNPAIVTVDPANVRGGTGAGFTGTPASISVNNIAGTVTFNAFQTSSAPTGQFTVANVTFTPVSPGTSNLTLSNVTLTDTTGAELSASRVGLSSATIAVIRNP